MNNKLLIGLTALLIAVSGVTAYQSLDNTSPIKNDLVNTSNDNTTQKTYSNEEMKEITSNPQKSVQYLDEQGKQSDVVTVDNKQVALVKPAPPDNDLSNKSALP